MSQGKARILIFDVQLHKAEQDSGHQTHHDGPLADPDDLQIVGRRIEVAFVDVNGPQRR